MKKGFLFALLCTLTIASQAQLDYEMEWQTQIPAMPDQLLVDSVGNSYTAIYSNNNPPNNYTISKYDTHGNPLWQSVTLPITNSGLPFLFQFDKQGSLLVGGTLQKTGGSGNDFYICKINTSGQVLWTTLVDHLNNNEALADFNTDAANNIILTGSSYSGTSKNKNFLTVKLNPGGTLLWQAAYNRDTSSYDKPVKVLSDASGNVYAYGDFHHGANSSTETDSLLFVKYTAAGTLSKIRVFAVDTLCPPQPPENARKAVMLGHTLFFSYTKGCFEQPQMEVVATMDTALGQKTFLYTQQGLSDMVACEKTKQVLMFSTYSQGYMGATVPVKSYLVNYKNGVLKIVELNAGNTSTSTPFSKNCTLLANGNFALTYVNNPVATNNLSVLDSAGTSLFWTWTTPYSYGGTILLSRPATDNANNIWVFNNVVAQGFTGPTLEKFSLSPLGLSSHDQAGSEIRVFPNPAQDRISLSASNITSSEAILLISDLQGRIVLKQMLVPKGTELREEINIEPLPAGMYLLHLQTGTQLHTRKLVKENR